MITPTTTPPTDTPSTTTPDSYEKCQELINRALGSSNIDELKQALNSINGFFSLRANKKKRESSVNGEGAFKRMMEASPSYKRMAPISVATPTLPKV